MPTPIETIYQELSNIGLVKQAPNNSNQDKNNDISVFNNFEESAEKKYEIDISTEEGHVHSCIDYLKNNVDNTQKSFKKRLIYNIALNLLDGIYSMFAK